MSLYWEFENGNKFSKSKFSYEAAEAYSRTLVNCKDCVNCRFCLDCIGCSSCYSCAYLTDECEVADN